MDNVTKDIHNEYQNIANDYDKDWSEYIEKTISETLKRLPEINDNDRILDVGCGTGELLLNLLKINENIKIVGIDLSSEMLNVFKSKIETLYKHKKHVKFYNNIESYNINESNDINYSYVELLSSSAEVLPFKDNSFDGILNTNCFHYFSKPEKVLNEMIRVLKPGGFIIITDWCDDFMLCKLCKFWLRITNKPFSEFYGTKSCSDIIKKVGFNIESIESYKVTVLWGMMTIIAYKNIIG